MRSVGYSELFVLSRDDVLCALRDHPEAEVGHVTRSLAYANFVGQNYLYMYCTNCCYTVSI